MNGPHGMYLMDLNPPVTRKMNPPFEVVETLRDGFEAEGGIRTVFLTVVDQTDAKGERNRLANAFCGNSKAGVLHATRPAPTSPSALRSTLTILPA